MERNMKLQRIGRALGVAIIAAGVVPLAGQAPQAPQTTSSGEGAPATKSARARPATSAKKWTVPRTAWGHPDLQGLWNNGTVTPLERPAELADREFLSEKEWQAFAKESAERAAQRPADVEADVALAYDNEWWDRGAPLARTSLITDPTNGKLPPLTPEGQKFVADLAAERAKHGYADSWVDRPLQERCLLYHGVPPFPTGYNNNYHIVQTPQTVAIRYEMMAETRIIPLDGRPHLGPRIPQWMGNSRGHWEGDTLVIETTDYSAQTTFRFPADYRTLKVVERFTRTGADAIDYQFTVYNPSMYTRPWTGVLPMSKTPGPIYEYACHEGNIGLADVLRGHRYEERMAAEEAAKKGAK
jgi:hypothetical protein